MNHVCSQVDVKEGAYRGGGGAEDLEKNPSRFQSSPGHDTKLFRLAKMAPVRVRASTSTFTSRVTLYEPTAASLNGSTSHSATSDVAIAPSPTRRRSNRLSGVKLEGDEEGELFKPNWEDDADEEKPTPKAKSPRKPKKHVEALDKPHPAPKRWEETYEVIRKQGQT